MHGPGTGSNSAGRSSPRRRDAGWRRSWARLAYAFDTVGSSEVVAFTERHNTRSRAVMERLGMTYVGRLPAGGVRRAGRRSAGRGPRSRRRRWRRRTADRSEPRQPVAPRRAG
ncbi:GNAT family protein, partial [Actinopolymorpha sp. B17G11]|uniref:GNAT family N-acetyltransferase n=1 Tax=Actinopolymorpha sp. B17G11 TaxID=3160861 RepID=UPI0032E4964F